MKFIFWNVERLGAATDATIKDSILDVTKEHRPDVAAFCELTSKNVYPKPINYSHRQNKDQQLCYGVLDYSTDPPTDLKADKIEEYLPQSTDNFEKAGFKGGNNFHAHSPLRGVACLKDLGGLDIFVFHAPGGDGLASVLFLLCSLHVTYRKPWLLVGDLNVEPKEITELVQKYYAIDIPIDDLIVNPGQPTRFNWKTGKHKEYDYAFTNMKKRTEFRIGALRQTRLMAEYSDHVPIILHW
ncbi:hypothetical protein ACQV5M_16695 [Leptospira sp. SA-E8]|uniref:hypothetical protein n=1 Tax=Leptospira sp. SA-E8 TaxID=3422259 RepID=UPI003EBA5785